MNARDRTPRRAAAMLLALACAAAAAVIPMTADGSADQPPPGPPDSGPAKRVALPGSAGHGRDLYAARGCAACHATTFEQEAKDGLLRAGHPLEGAAHRGTWWNGRITTDAGDASEFCLKTFIDPDSEGFTPEERKALVLFMQELGSERGVSPLVLLRRDAGDVDVAGGDPKRGREVWRRACQSCHPGEREAAVSLIGQLSATQISGVVRQGTGTMPFYQVDRLPPSLVADVAAYLVDLRDSTQSP